MIEETADPNQEEKGSTPRVNITELNCKQEDQRKLSVANRRALTRRDV